MKNNWPGYVVVVEPSNWRWTSDATRCLFRTCGASSWTIWWNWSYNCFAMDSVLAFGHGPVLVPVDSATNGNAMAVVVAAVVVGDSVIWQVVVRAGTD